MSPQHDYIIDNSTGANVRSDINSVLQAIASNNSGSSAPSTTYALQFHADTTNDILKLRNAANNAFVNLRKFDGSLPLPDGSVSSPSLFFDDDTNTGIFSGGADEINIVAGGSRRADFGNAIVFNEDGADVDLRIEGDTEANLFYVDAGNNRIGIGTNDPQTPIHAKFNGGVVFRLEDSSDNNYSHIFNNSDDLYISADRNNTGSGNLIFRNGGTSERMRINSSGQVGIGTTTIGNKLQVHEASSNASFAGFSNDTTGSSSSDGLIVGVDSNEDGLLYHYENKAIRFGTNNAERMRIDSSGQVGIGTTSPDNNVEVASAEHTSILLQSDRTSSSSNIGSIDFRSASTDVARIQSLADGTIKFRNTSSLTERMRIDTSGNVGIGTTSPSDKLTISQATTGSLLLIETTNNNTRAQAELKGKDSSGNAVRLRLGGDGDSHGNIFTVTNHKLGFATNNAAPQMVLDTSGNVGIGTSSPSEKLNVSGNILATGTITPNSDIAFKKDIQPLTNVLNKVTQLLGINFTYKNNNEKSMGLVAQDVEKVFPELVRGEEGNKSLNYMGLTGALIEAIKELSAKVEALEAA